MTRAKKSPAKTTTKKKAPAKTSKPKTASTKKTKSSTKKLPQKSRMKSPQKYPSMKTVTTKSGKKVVLLSGGNPQIAKADGDAPVQAYIAAVPGWKRDVARRLDALITRTLPRVRKAVRWNSPFYAAGDDGWFLSFHCFAKYVKVGFFRGASLRPVPPVASKHDDVRYLHIHEVDAIDDK
jgi:hypothetical protein